MRHIPRKTWNALCLAAAGLLFAGTANAQIPVTDVAHIGINEMAWVEQYRQMYSDEIKQAQQIQNQIQQIQTKIRDMEQQYVNGLKFEGTSGYRDASLTERSMDASVSETCEKLNAGGLWSRLTGGGSGTSSSGRVDDVLSRQYTACIQLVRTENRRYNLVVKTLEKIRERDQEIARLRAESAGASGEQRGLIDRNNNSIAQLEAQHALDVEAAHRTLQAYDALIVTLKSEMGRAAQSAFTDKDQLLGDVVRYGALKLALEGARLRRR